MVYKQIPGYESYQLTPDGQVYNRSGKLLKPIQTKKGLCVELRGNGQRDVIVIDDLIKQVYGGTYEDQRRTQDSCQNIE